MSPAAAAIEVIDLCKSYATADQHIPALDQLSFRIEPGEFVSVLGPSGCGKTTVLKIIAGLVGATSGTVKVDGTAVTGPQRKIGLVFQVPALMKWRTALENVLLPSEILGLDRGPAEKRARELLDLVGLPNSRLAIPANCREACNSGLVSLARLPTIRPFCCWMSHSARST